MTNKLKRTLRPIYRKVSFLPGIYRALRRYGEYLSSVPFRMISSPDNLKATAKLTENRFLYAGDFFNDITYAEGFAPVDIDVSVVTYNSSAWVDKFFDSLVNQSYPLEKIRLCFVDHSSADDTVERLEKYAAKYADAFGSVKIIVQDNLGFGAGHNRAISSGSSDFCLITNIDLVFTSDAVSTVVKHALADTGGKAASWELRQIPFEHPKYYDPVTLETNWSSHACILLRRSSYEAVGGYEPKIFMYAEDVELSYRFRSEGYVLKYCPDAVVEHFSYEKEGHVKPLQYELSTLGCAYVRLRYGRFADRLQIVLIYLILLFSKEKYKNSRKALFRNIKKIINNYSYFRRTRRVREGFYAPFRGIDYDFKRNGGWYQIALPDTGSTVSIVVRTYKGREILLMQALMSIFNQTYGNIEVIVVEDGGQTMAPLIESVRSRMNVKYFGLEKVGRSAAGNYGLSVASGDYCMFLDDDDILFADHVEVLIAALNRNDDHAAAYSLTFEIPTVFEGDSKSSYTEKEYRSLKGYLQEFDYEVLLDHNYFPIQSVLFRRTLYLERGGFDESLTYLEDWNLWLRYAYGNRFVYVPKTTSLYRVPASAVESDSRNMLLNRAYGEAKEKAAAAVAEYQN
ncbi:glycosyltransferase [Seleniivibrio woodruffii]|uniref:glycosyltransferase n=1 Tax=Seleniivibrio woodruffii TaxID=1078050 RepID=UPI0026EF4EBC|nr:glycosyltransferase [Seleniivibrio woodruffii]